MNSNTKWKKKKQIAIRFFYYYLPEATSRLSNINCTPLYYSAATTNTINTIQIYLLCCFFIFELKQNETKWNERALSSKNINSNTDPHGHFIWSIESNAFSYGGISELFLLHQNAWIIFRSPQFFPS